jgi:ankyrin repeat protein
MSDIEEAAATLGETLIEQILDNKPFDIIRASLDAGAPVWYQNQSEGISPLHAAAFTQNANLVKFLIEEGAVWNAGIISICYISRARLIYFCSGLSQKYCRRHSSIIQQ